MQCVECPCYKFDGRKFCCEYYSWADMNEPDRGMYASNTGITDGICPGVKAQMKHLQEAATKAYDSYKYEINRMRCLAAAMGQAEYDSLRKQYVNAYDAAARAAQKSYQKYSDNTLRADELNRWLKINEEENTYEPVTKEN